MTRRAMLAAAVLALAPPGGGGAAAAQAAPRVISLAEALELGLEGNYDVRIAQRQYAADQVRRSIGGAGLLPELSASAGRLVEVEDVTPGGAPGPTRSDIASLYGSLDLDWTVFDGFRGVAAYRRLTEQERLGHAALRLQAAHTISDIVAAYYGVVREKELLRAREDAVAFSEERLRIARTMRELGAGSEYQLLLARADLNTDRAAVIRQELIVADARLDLARLLGLPADSELDVHPGIPLGEELAFHEIDEGFRDGNIEVEAARLREAVAAARRSEVHRSRLPVIGLRAGYGVARDDPRLPAGALEDIRGFHFGLVARVPLFDGLNLHRASQIAELELETRRIELEEQHQLAEAALRAEYRNYTHARRLVQLEEENLEIADRALSIALEQFRVANITSTELRETQHLVLDTENRLLQARYDAKLAETELLRLTGTLAQRLGLE